MTNPPKPRTLAEVTHPAMRRAIQTIFAMAEEIRAAEAKPDGKAPPPSSSGN